MLQARENLMEAIQAFLKKYDQIPPKDKSMALLLAAERFLKIKQAVEEEQNQPENIQELLLKLINDLQILNGIQLKQEEQIAKVIAITPDLPITDSLIMEDEHLTTIPEMKSDKENESSVKDLIPILKNIESKDSYVSNFDEPALLVTHLSDANEDECFDPSSDVNEIELLLHHDLSTPKISVASILEGFTDEPPLEDNDDLFDLESKENEWKKILNDAPIDDLMTEDKVFDLGILEKFFSPTYVSLPFEDRHYLSLTYVIQIFLPCLTYYKDSFLLLSFESEDTILDPDIFVFCYYSLEPVVSHQSGTFMCASMFI
ncbi:hypothetical protein Tco_0929893 [Tanacetum coccineum]